ncbi:extracellular solute-binding protein [Paenibacillus graminis]|uniref:extracellular solute-binding protein n=1 Tax=Paenibacillus graminis TaxID=189425 RepID=UPI002DBC9CF2|nr:extracellular solute-binding protein [Paenibacillus graminis]MEC0167686.1 extracellular solute-binding protein [Paenibacillus graminis]
MKKRNTGFLALAFMLSSSLVLGACGSNNNAGGAANGNTGSSPAPSADNSTEGNTKTEGSGEAVNLSFWTLFDGGDGDNMQKLVDEFNKSHPDIKVKNTKLVWAEYYTKLITAVGNGNGPDIGISHTSRLPDLINQGVVTGLDTVAGEAGVDWATFNQNLLDATVVDGKHYAVPIDTHPFIMYYNKKLLKEAGLLGDDGKPVLEQSADGFLAFLKTLKEKLPAKTTPFALSNSNDDPYRLWWALYSQLGGNDLVSDDLKKAEIDKAKGIQAAEYIQKLFTEGYIKKNDPDFYKNFQSGTAAIMMTGVWATGTWETTKGLEFGAMPIPKLVRPGSDLGRFPHDYFAADQVRRPCQTKSCIDLCRLCSRKRANLGKSGPYSLQTLGSGEAGIQRYALPQRLCRCCQYREIQQTINQNLADP